MFLLLLMGLGAASVKAQVRIGGNASPNAAAVLDLNATDDATPTGNNGGLALPRVSLSSATAQLNGNTPIIGMLVYNTNASMTGGNGVGMYFWNGSGWCLVPFARNNPILFVLIQTFAGDVAFPAIGAGSYASVSTPGTSNGDWCTDYSSRNIAVANVGVNYVNVQPLNTFATVAGTHRVVCYRPLQTN